MKRSIPIVLLLLSACQRQAAPAQIPVVPMAWIDAPLDGSRLPLRPVTITAHFYHPAGISQVELSVDGAVVSTSPGPERRHAVYVDRAARRPPLPAATSSPCAPRAPPASGAPPPRPRSRSPAPARLPPLRPPRPRPPPPRPRPDPDQRAAADRHPAACRAAADRHPAVHRAAADRHPAACRAAADRHPAVPAASATALPLPPSGSPRRPPPAPRRPHQRLGDRHQRPATATPLPPTATPTQRVPAPPTAELSADPTSITAGSCATLSWRTTNAESVSLNGVAVEPSGQQQVCPEVTTTYSLAASNAAGKISREVTISVSSPPSLGRPSASTDRFATVAGCDIPAEITISVVAENLIDGSATVFYRVAERPLAVAHAAGTRRLLVADPPERRRGAHRHHRPVRVLHRRHQRRWSAGPDRGLRRHQLREL